MRKVEIVHQLGGQLESIELHTDGQLSKESILCKIPKTIQNNMPTVEELKTELNKFK